VTTIKRTTGFLALVACVLATGCGSDEEGAGIPRSSAASLDRQLDSIQNRFDFGGAACTDITDGNDPNTTAVQNVIDRLPANVDADVRDALEQGFSRLFELVDEQCKKPQTQTETETVTEPAAPPPETETVTTPPETTETTPPPTETTQPPPTDTGEEEVPPDQGGSTSGGEGGSGGSGQGGDGQAGSGGGALVPEDQG
jgi:hypothetical protein